MKENLKIVEMQVSYHERKINKLKPHTHDSDHREKQPFTSNKFIIRNTVLLGLFVTQEYKS